MNRIIVFSAQYLLVFVVLLLAIAWLKTAKQIKIKFLVATILSGIIALVISRIASKLYFDPRPFVTQHVKPLFPHAADNGFPSDHALLTGTLTAITYFYSKKFAVWMTILTFLVGLARVLAKVHSPLDIAAGWVFGIIGAVTSYYLVEWYFGKYRSATKKQQAGVSNPPKS